jgi:putative ABC transport system ATP-binding protein
MLILEDVSHGYETAGQTVAALRRASLRAEAGELVVIVGPSGSGKSTLLSVAAGILPVQHGSVEVDGFDLSSATVDARAEFRLRRIGVVFQDAGLLPGLSVLDNVALVEELAGTSRSQALRAAGDALAAVGMDGQTDRFPNALSGGQRQRVGIARCLAGDRSLLLVDEPTAALDGDTSQQIMDVIRAVTNQGVAVVVSTHDPIVTDAGDQVVALRDGAVTARTGPVASA